VDKQPAAPGAPAKALKYDKKSGLSFGLPLRDLTADEVAAWVSKPKYDEMIASGAYSVVDETPAAKEDKKP
jgi:hypothetical protein